METKNMNQKIFCHNFTMVVPGEQRNPSVHIDWVEHNPLESLLNLGRQKSFVLRKPVPYVE